MMDNFVADVLGFAIAIAFIYYLIKIFFTNPFMYMLKGEPVEEKIKITPTPTPTAVPKAKKKKFEVPVENSYDSEYEITPLFSD